jgi:hypothetical protein
MNQDFCAPQVISGRPPDALGGATAWTYAQRSPNGAISRSTCAFAHGSKVMARRYPSA